MSENGPIRLSKAAKELNVGLTTVVDFLATKGIKIEGRPNTKIEAEAYQLLVDEYAPDRAKKQKSEALSQTKVVRETITLDTSSKDKGRAGVEQEEILIKNVGGFQESKEAPPAPVKPEPEVKVEAIEPAKEEVIKAETKVEETKPIDNSPKIDTSDASDDSADGKGPNILGKIDLSSIKSNRPKKKIAEKTAEKVENKTAEKESPLKPESKTEEISQKKEVKEEVKKQDSLLQTGVCCDQI